MIDLDEIIEAIEACQEHGMEFLEICERVARVFEIPQDFVEAVYDSLDGVPLDEDKWEDVIHGGDDEDEDDDDEDEED